MRTPAAVLLLMLSASCAGMKISKEPPPAQPKPGITWGGSPVGKFEVKKVGYWCDAHHGVFTFGEFGPTEAEARVNATNSCLKMYREGPCEIASCKEEK